MTFIIVRAFLPFSFLLGLVCFMSVFYFARLDLFYVRFLICQVHTGAMNRSIHLSNFGSVTRALIAETVPFAFSAH